MSVRVAISSTWHDLDEERRALDAALYHMRCALDDAIVPARVDPEAPRDVHLEVIEGADVYVGVYGHRYGALDGASGLSVTEIEYRRAVERGIPRLIYIKSEETPVLPAQVEHDPNKLAKLEALKAELRRSAVIDSPVYFRDPEDLVARVVRDLEALLFWERACGQCCAFAHDPNASNEGPGRLARRMASNSSPTPADGNREQVIAAARMAMRGEGAAAGAPATARCKAGRALARLGDPRREVMVPEAAQFCRVPGGDYWVGGPAVGFPGEDRRRRIEIPRDYYIARYPVTNAQFQVFADAGGYGVSAYWAEAARQRGGTSTGRWYCGALFDDRGGAVGGYDEPFDLANHPVANVSWYSALAYARWLGERLAAMGGCIEVYDPATGETTTCRLDGVTVRLPTEIEWEAAARGPDGRPYPWGAAPDPERANYGDTGIGATSAVGCFPRGASPCGAEEMSGNVWEWTATKWRPEYPDGEADDSPWGDDRRVVRGGSFCYEAAAVRAAARSWELPELGAGYVGFRVVAVGESSTQRR